MVKTPSVYLGSLAAPRRKIPSAIHKAIRAAVPKLKPHIIHVMLGYGLYHYEYASGRDGDWFVVGLASQNNYVSLYICACDTDGYLAESNQSRLGKVLVGRSCIGFKELVGKAAVLTHKQGWFSM